MDQEYVRTKLEHLANETDLIKQTYSKKYDDLEGLMRSQLKGELDEFEEKLKKVQSELGETAHQSAEAKVNVDHLQQEMKEVKSLINMVS